MATDWLVFSDIERRVCDIAAAELGLSREWIKPEHSLVEDLGCDSLDYVELLMTIEDEFDVALPEDAGSPVYKAVFTRRPFRLKDLAELVYLQQGSGKPLRNWWRNSVANNVVARPFTQLNGTWCPSAEMGSLYESVPNSSADALPMFRRLSDGMRCVLLSQARVEIGSDVSEDETPRHMVELGPFLIDVEPVSTTAYCRFLDSIGEATDKQLEDWFVLAPEDDRIEHMLIARTSQGWRPRNGTERRPMILVSWFGANAYSLWANGRDWRNYRDDAGLPGECFLPSESQWEYAARGTRYREFPWGDGPPSQDLLRYALHRRSATYDPESLPLADVNLPLGLSPFGLHHMAGNIWQWCRDWYDSTFYRKAEARTADPVNRISTGVRSERGGSWIGPAELCRSSYRRGRPPFARGRCLGFRCIGHLKDLGSQKLLGGSR